jgi:hypothetical protein
MSDDRPACPFRNAEGYPRVTPRPAVTAVLDCAESLIAKGAIW